MNERPLRDDEKAPVLDALLESEIASKSICRHAVESSRFISFPRSPPPLSEGIRPVIAYLALRKRASGIALGTRVYIRRNLIAEHQTLPLFLITHELAHVVQFLRDGTAPFLVRYFGEYLGGRLRGMGDRNAYLAISYEREARRVESCLDLE